MKKISVSKKNWQLLMKIKNEKSLPHVNSVLSFLLEKPTKPKEQNNAAVSEQKLPVVPHVLYEDITDDIDRIIKEKKL